MKLSICIVTMNRANQLKEAIKSCLACALPDKTEFVIIDNASVDQTEKTVHNLMKTCEYSYYYEKMLENLGVGKGRNYAYSKSNGDYVYMLDDDAVIDFERNPNFFIHAISVLESHCDIVTLTTQIYDTSWNKNRLLGGGPMISQGLYKCLMFCGGSHFLKKSFFTSDPYIPNKYGYEEILPSLRAIDAGKINAFYPNLLIIHKPVINKWNYSEAQNQSLLVKGIALPYAIKKMLFPRIFTPILFIAHILRRRKYTASIPKSTKLIKQLVRETIAEYPLKNRIKVGTVIKMVKDFGASTF